MAQQKVIRAVIASIFISININILYYTSIDLSPSFERFEIEIQKLTNGFRRLAIHASLYSNSCPFLSFVLYCVFFRCAPFSSNSILLRYYGALTYLTYSEKRKPPLFVITLFSSNLSCTNCQDKHAKGNIDYWKQTIKNHVIIDNIHIAIITITQSAHNSRKNI